MEACSDAELVRRVVAGEAAPYEVLVRRHQETMYRHAFGMLGDGDAAADMVQDTFVKAYTRLGTCDPDRFAAWLFRILRNRCKDYLKSRRRRDVPLLDDAPHPAPPGDDPGVRLDQAQIAAVVTDALPASPPRSARPFS